MFQFSKYEIFNKYKFNNRRKPEIKYYLIILPIFSIIIIFFLKYIIFKYRTNNIFYSPEYIYCYSCSKNITSECDKACPPEILFENLKVASNFDTLDEIIKNKKSISRFGDGEYRLLLGMGHEFESANKNLSEKLSEVLNSKENNCLVGIYLPLDKEREKYIPHESAFWVYFIKHMKWRLFKAIKQDRQYYSAIISKFYVVYRNKSSTPKYVKKLKQVWNNKDIVIIEGKDVKFGIGNDLLNNTKSIKRIICPSREAFSVYNKIMEAVLKFDKNNLILISLGQTATVLSFDLCKLGYQAIDIGHTDRDYEAYVRKAKYYLFKDEAKVILGNVTEMNEIYTKQIVNIISKEN